MPAGQMLEVRHPEGQSCRQVNEEKVEDAEDQLAQHRSLEGRLRQVEIPHS